MDSPSVFTCKNKIIKYSTNNITFFENDNVYKQFSFDAYKWVNEVLIVNYLSHPNIIKFNKCEIIHDYIIDTKNKEIVLDEKEMVIRITMKKYDSTLSKLKKYTDTEIFFVLDNLLAALLYCQSKDVIHRDIKEANIFVNFTLKSRFGKNKRVITNLVLADFNISKYKYCDNSNTSKIMTVSHRSPEISKALLKNNNCVYDDRIDVWSFCIVLSYLITGKSFYLYLHNSYLITDPGIIYNSSKLGIIMKHFIKLFAYKKLKHIQLYTKLISDGITTYINRKTFNQLHNTIYVYSVKNNIPFKRNVYWKLVGSPEYTLYKNVLIRKLHILAQHSDIQILTYFRIHNHMEKKKFKFNNIRMFALYILVAMLISSNIKSIEFYINLINLLKLRPSDKNIITKKSINLCIHVIIKFNNYSII